MLTLFVLEAVEQTAVFLHPHHPLTGLGGYVNVALYYMI
jgi:hypothetical protein